MCKHEGIYLGRLMKALHKFFIVQEFILIRLGAGEQELCLGLGVVLVALHGLMEVSLGDDTCELIHESINHISSSLHFTLELFFLHSNDSDASPVTHAMKERLFLEPCLFRQGRTP